MSLKALAVELGVSVSTVSRALNGFPEVAPGTREAVLAAAARARYRPHAGARRLALGRSNTVGLVLPTRGDRRRDGTLPEVISAMAESLAQAGVELLLFTPWGQDELAAYERASGSGRVDAFVVLDPRVRDPRLAWLREWQVDFVTLGRSQTLQGPYAWMDVDHEAAGALAAQRLLKWGHRCFGYLGAPTERDSARRAFRGLCRALEQGQGRLAPGAVLHTAQDAATGHAAMVRLLGLGNRPTAVVVDNGAAGAGAAQALAQAGMHLGAGVSLVVCGRVTPEFERAEMITALRPPEPSRSGALLAGLVLSLLKGDCAERLHVLQAPWLHEGRSDGPAPGSGGTGRLPS